MFLQSKTAKFFLALAAFLYFAFQWLYNYAMVWYHNIPEETIYYKKPVMGYYLMTAYLFLVCFILFIIVGIIYLKKDPVPKLITYLLIGILVVAAYDAWVYSTSFKRLHTAGIAAFSNMALYAFAIFKLGSKD